MSYEDEMWLPVVGYEGVYEVSDYGRVKNCKKGKILKQRSNGIGYLKVSLSKSGETISYYVHRIVAIAFIPNPENKRTVNHKNGVKGDNKLINLEWMTQAENVAHAYRELGKTFNMEAKFASDHAKEKPVIQMTRDGGFVAAWASAASVFRENGFSFRNISACCKGHRKTCCGYKWMFAIPGHNITKWHPNKVEA